MKCYSNEFISTFHYFNGQSALMRTYSKDYIKRFFNSLHYYYMWSAAIIGAFDDCYAIPPMDSFYDLNITEVRNDKSTVIIARKSVYDGEYEFVIRKIGIILAEILMPIKQSVISNCCMIYHSLNCQKNVSLNVSVRCPYRISNNIILSSYLIICHLSTTILYIDNWN